MPQIFLIRRLYYTDQGHSRGGPLHIEKLRYKIVEDANKYWLNGIKDMGYKVLDPNNYQAEGFSQFDFTTKEGSRFSTYKAYILPILDRKNLEISIYSQATKIHFDKYNRAYGVTYKRHGVKKFARARKEIIISGGVMESPRLLMLSGIGPKSHLNKIGIKCLHDLPVGQNLQDHLFGFVGPFLLNSPVSFVSSRDTSLSSIWEYHQSGTGVFAFPTVSGGGVLSSSLDNSTWPDIFYLFSPVAQTLSLVEDFEGLMGLPKEFLTSIFTKHAEKDSFSVGVSAGRPKSIGEILLIDKNPDSPLSIDPKYLSHPDDVRVMLDGIKFIIDLMENSKTFKELGASLPNDRIPGCEQFVFKTEDYWKCVFSQFVTTMFHHCGTCRMGKTNDRASTPVVDSNLRLVGVPNLRIIDASIFPNVTNANINAPTIMLGEKGSDIIREFWSKQYSVCLLVEYLLYFVESKCYYSHLA